MTNDEVAIRFARKKSAKGSNLESTGTKLISYETTIAEWFDEGLTLNMTRYSYTTDKHMRWLIWALGPDLVAQAHKCFNAPKGVKDLMY